ncbi:MAG: cytidine deaminase [Blastocatellia bacterium]|nr:cytidine deaminase [Blastocatellia bacterium]
MKSEKKPLSDAHRQDLIARATEARSRAHAPYSGFKVGAAILTSSDHIYSGCNIENASYGLSLCAERVALVKALSEGERDFQAITVITSDAKLTSPCGPCRQLIWEFCGDIEVVLANLDGDEAHYTMSELFPRPFDDFEPDPKSQA